MTLFLGRDNFYDLRFWVYISRYHMRYTCISDFLSNFIFYNRLIENLKQFDSMNVGKTNLTFSLQFMVMRFTTLRLLLLCNLQKSSHFCQLAFRHCDLGLSQWQSVCMNRIVYEHGYISGDIHDPLDIFNVLPQAIFNVLPQAIFMNRHSPDHRLVLGKKNDPLG